MAILLILAIGVAFGIGYWNLRASFHASRGADWRTNRDGLRAPGTSQSFNQLHVLASAVLLALLVFRASAVVLLAAALIYAIGFAVLADQERRRAAIYYRGNI